jgi:ribonuclease R
VIAEPDRFVAVVARRGRVEVAEPLFEPGPQVNLARGSTRVRPATMVLAERRGAAARVVAELGSPKIARDVVGALLEERLGRGFPRRIEDDAREAAATAESAELERRDLRGLDTFTVDPASARDFDDAVSASETADGTRLWIHIADVAAHVRPGSALDAEARRRANSTYVPGVVEPMLPPALSDEACSLAPGVDRLAVTTEIELGDDGIVRSAAFYRSRVRSDARLSYDQLDRYFTGSDRPPPEIEQPLALARRAAAALYERRRGRALAVESSEPEFQFDADGRPERADDVSQTEAHRLIEQLMIATNEQVASLCERRSRSRRLRSRNSSRTPRPASSRSRRADWSPPRPSGADTAARRIPHSCSARSSQPCTRTETPVTPVWAARPTPISPRRSGATRT